MRLSNVKRISKEDMSKKGEVPGWIEPMLETLNTFIEQVTTAMNGNLSLKDNLLAKEYIGEFTHNVPVEINPQLDGRSQLRVYGVIPMDTNGAEVVGTRWTKLNNGKITFTFQFGSALKAKCVLQILLR